MTSWHESVGHGVFVADSVKLESTDTCFHSACSRVTPHVRGVLCWALAVNLAGVFLQFQQYNWPLQIAHLICLPTATGSSAVTARVLGTTDLTASSQTYHLYL